MLVTDGFSAGARASSPAELPMCSGTPAGQDARSPMLRRSRPFFAAKSAKKRRLLTPAKRRDVRVLRRRCDDASCGWTYVGWALPEPQRERHRRSPSGEAVPRPLRTSSALIFIQHLIEHFVGRQVDRASGRESERTEAIIRRSTPRSKSWGGGRLSARRNVLRRRYPCLRIWPQGQAGISSL